MKLRFRGYDNPKEGRVRCIFFNDDFTIGKTYTTAEEEEDAFGNSFPDGIVPASEQGTNPSVFIVDEVGNAVFAELAFFDLVEEE